MKRLPGYHADIDAVSISYDGSIGEIIEIEGVRILLPKKPDNVWARSSRKKDQYFERQELPAGFNKDNHKVFSRYIEEQFQYKDEGFWFMNNGKPEYVTGAHWFLLQWCKGDAEPSTIYPTGEFYYFTKAQQKLAYYMEAAWVDTRSFGIAFVKPRRFGATGFGLAFFLSKAITKANGKFGITSMKESEAKKAYERLGHMFRNLPPFFQPLNRGVSATGIVFKSPEKRTTAKTKSVEYEEDLNTEIDYQATGVKAYDSRALTGYLADESSKYAQDVNVVEHWSSVRKTQTKGAKITGKTFMLTTIENYNGIEDPYDRAAGSGDRFMYIYDNSDPRKRNKNGRTQSGLYRIFISCYEHYEGRMDIYGYPIVHSSEEGVMSAEGDLIKVGIKEWIENEIADYTNIRDLYNELRKTPRTEDDLRKIVGGNSLFDTAKINQQIEYNNKLLRDEDIIRGNFRWVNNIQDGQVEFIPSSNGRFWIKWMPKAEMRNRITFGGGGVKFPGNPEVGVFGVDPYRLDAATGGSKGAIHGYSKTNAVGAPNEDFFLEYIDKPPIREIFFEDVIMCCVFYGMQALIESNVNEILREMYKRGYTKYSMRRPDKDERDLTRDERKYGGIPSNGASIIKTHAACIQTFIEDHIGPAIDDKYRHIGVYGQMSFNRTMADWVKFDIDDRTRFDASISSGLALFGAQKFNIGRIVKEIAKCPVPLYERGQGGWRKLF